MSVLDQTVREFLNDVATPGPPTTGGSVAAVAAAAAAGLVTMTARLSASGDGESATAARAEVLRDEAATLVQADIGSYRPVLDAQRLSKDDPGRTATLRDALRGAAGPPRRLCEVAEEVGALAAALATRAPRPLRGDAVTAATLAAAAARSAMALVQINVSAAGDPAEQASRAEQAAQEAVRHADHALAAISV